MTKNKEIIINYKIYKLSLEYFLGFFEGYGSLTIQLKPNLRHKTGKQIILIFEIHQHVVDKDLLKAISFYLECGKVEIGRKVGNDNNWVYNLRISSQKEKFEKLLPILQSQSMILKKRDYDLILFLKACKLVVDKKHITDLGQKEIKLIVSQLSSKLNLEDKKNLPDTFKTINKEWLTGITDAEGNFQILINTSTTSNFTDLTNKIKK